MSDATGMAFAVVALAWVLLAHWRKIWPIEEDDPLPVVQEPTAGTLSAIADLGADLAQVQRILDTLIADDAEMQRQLDSLKAGIVLKSAFTK